MSGRPAILFVCMGNICRSPLAEAAFRAAAARHGLDVAVESAGTGDWHAGEPPDRRAQEVARRHGIDIAGYRARMVTAEDFRTFSHIVALDHTNLTHLRTRRPPDATARLSLLLDHVPGRQGQGIADPYFGHVKDFDTTWADVSAGAEALARALAMNTQSME
ncbi:protein-tyrosine-phosphatase [Gluconacetobacter johannae DSM 13595]|uniref:protein-tyrosine-phosphatase n=1 Tax=Gluconacetobacter johannae TaxID=112140 RepID=A0A7W4J7S8_9PROT|nr:low molecular weight protein-tyrosine-phosphatase [Gluconacetobacter johannae]MBB2176275.1 low molecular weight phosphotyrosine protein phosphatase [Gluconacetobacter johannae]GBQ90624.1 protein-tyrosine-phosphatase [Gluconacetobacter johannae DSM 13595]